MANLDSQLVARLVGDRVRSARMRAGLTQQDLGSRAGITKNSVYLLETGRMGTTLLTLCNIALALGREPAELLPPMNQLFGTPRSADELVDQYFSQSSTE